MILGLAPEKHIDLKLFKDKFYDVWHFCLESLGELARHLDFKTVSYDGTLMPFEHINAHTIFDDHTDKYGDTNIELTNPLHSGNKLIKYEAAEKKRKTMLEESFKEDAQQLSNSKKNPIL